MNSGLNPANPLPLSAFPSALVHQWAIVALIFALLLIAWGMTRTWVAGRDKAVLVCAVAGALVALAERAWETPQTGRLILAGTGAFFAVNLVAVIVLAGLCAVFC